MQLYVHTYIIHTYLYKKGSAIKTLNQERFQKLNFINIMRKTIILFINFLLGHNKLEVINESININSVNS